MFFNGLANIFNKAEYSKEELIEKMMKAYSVKPKYSNSEIMNELKSALKLSKKAFDNDPDVNKEVENYDKFYKMVSEFKFKEISSAEKAKRESLQDGARRLVSYNVANYLINKRHTGPIFGDKTFDRFVYNMASSSDSPEEAEEKANIIMFGTKEEKQKLFNDFASKVLNAAEYVTYARTDEELLDYLSKGQNYNYVRLLTELQNENLKKTTEQLGIDFPKDIENRLYELKDIVVEIGAVYNRIGQIASPYYTQVESTDIEMVDAYYNYYLFGVESSKLMDMTMPPTESFTNGELTINTLKDYFCSTPYSSQIVERWGLLDNCEELKETKIKNTTAFLKYYVKKEFNIDDIENCKFTDRNGKELNIKDACDIFINKEPIALRSSDNKFLCRLVCENNNYSMLKPINDKTNSIDLLNTNKNEIKAEFQKMLSDLKAVDGIFTRINSTQEFKDLRKEVEALAKIDVNNPEKAIEQLTKVSNCARAYLDRKYSDKDPGKVKNETTFKREDLAERFMNFGQNSIDLFVEMTNDREYNINELAEVAKEECLDLNQLEEDTNLEKDAEKVYPPKDEHINEPVKETE